LIAATEAAGGPPEVLNSLAAPGWPCAIAVGEAGKRDEDAPATAVADEPAGASV
jgi:hypothetical protein